MEFRSLTEKRQEKEDEVNFGHLRFWFGGQGRLAELPDVDLRSAAVESPRGADSYYDFKLDFLGVPNDQTVELLQALAMSQRFVMVSLRFFVEMHLRERMPAKRYRKVNLTLVRLDAQSHTLWGSDPIAVLVEAKKLEEGIGEGWEEDDVLVEAELPEGNLAESRFTTHTYILREKSVVDLMAIVSQQVRARIIAGCAIALVVGFALGHLLR